MLLLLLLLLLQNHLLVAAQSGRAGTVKQCLVDRVDTNCRDQVGTPPGNPLTLCGASVSQYVNRTTPCHFGSQERT
jgi:hypothetical protein